MSYLSYRSVEEYFEKEYPILRPSLDNPGEFWLAVRHNTISNEELDRRMTISMIGGSFRDPSYVYVYEVCVALMRASLALPWPVRPERPRRLSLAVKH